jgi:hypothetical protein
MPPSIFRVDVSACSPHMARHAPVVKAVIQRIRVRRHNSGCGESLRGVVLIHIYTDHHQVLRPVAVHEISEPRKGLAARRAPGRPEVEIDDLAPVSVQVQAGGVRCTDGRNCHRDRQHANPEPNHLSALTINQHFTTLRSHEAV